MVEKTTPVLQSGDIFKVNSNPLEEILKVVDLVRSPETGLINKQRLNEESFKYFRKCCTISDKSKKI